MFEQRVNSDVLTVSTVNSQDQVTQKPLRDSVKQALKNYFAQLNGQDKLVIRTKTAMVLAAKQRYRQRMEAPPYQWRKPDKLRR
ncbi:hypothetical protein ACSLPA_24300 [Escherichia coli]